MAIDMRRVAGAALEAAIREATPPPKPEKKRRLSSGRALLLGAGLATAGRIAAEQITPYPPGIPVVVPGERITQPVIDYLRSGLEAGMVLPDPADPSLETIRVVA